MKTFKTGRTTETKFLSVVDFFRLFPYFSLLQCRKKRTSHRSFREHVEQVYGMFASKVIRNVNLQTVSIRWINAFDIFFSLSLFSYICCFHFPVNMFAILQSLSLSQFRAPPALFGSIGSTRWFNIRIPSIFARILSDQRAEIIPFNALFQWLRNVLVCSSYRN